MADLVTHVSLALLWRATPRAAPRRSVPVFVAGTCAPDLLGHLPGRLFQLIPGTPADIGHLFLPMHLPIGILLTSYALAHAFPEAERLPQFRALLGGGFFHLAVDLLQDHLGAGYILAFPFSHWHGELGLIDTEATVVGAPILAVLAALVARWRWGSLGASWSRPEGPCTMTR